MRQRGGGEGANLNTKDNLFTYPKLFSIQIHIRFQISISISNTLDLKSSILHHIYLSYLVKHLFNRLITRTTTILSF